MLKLKHKVLIRRPVEEVFQFVATDYFQNRPKWAPIPKEVEILEIPEGPANIGVTARYRSEDQWGRIADTTFLVTEYEPSRKLGIKTETRFAEHQPKRKASQKAYAGVSHTSATSLFEPVEGGTEITFVNVLWFTGIGKIAGWFTERRVALTLDETLEKGREAAYNIKNLLETEVGLPPGKRPLSIRRSWVIGSVYILIFTALLWVHGAREDLHLLPDWITTLRAAMIIMIVVGFLALVVKGIVQSSDIRRD
ncbi:MAG TPA: SRPBCC family protein [Chloroflexia bacterium]|nr:SRPBCC family protein [Chloroflexia bacterium]